MTEDPDKIPGKILVGASGKSAEDRAYRYLLLPLGNRHGLISGATGGGKTVSLQKLAEGFSKAGTAVFLADVKGDIAGLSQPGDSKPAFVARAKDLGLTYGPDHFPVVFWDVYGEQGHPVRATIAEMGPLLLSRMLDLNDTQEGVLNIVFRVADEQGLSAARSEGPARRPRLRLRQRLGHSKQIWQCRASHDRRHPAPASRAGEAGRRQILRRARARPQGFHRAGAATGAAIINILAADKLMQAPRLYATFLLWMLSELFEQLPEVGDLDKPKLVFFFDEAHLLFNDAPKALLDRDRAGGAPGPLEGCRRLFRDAKSARRAGYGARPARQPRPARSARLHPARPEGRCVRPPRRSGKTRISTPRKRSCSLASARRWCRCSTPRERRKWWTRALIAPPAARVGPITPQERQAVIEGSPLYGLYDTPMDRESAYEVLQKRAGARMESVGAGPAKTPDAQTPPVVEASADGGILGKIGGMVGGLFSRTNPKRMSPAELAARAALQSAARSVGTQITREVMRNIFGGMSR